jgi:hypothetical protein
MIPPFIVRRAVELALGVIAITDHNSAENVSAVIEAAQGLDLRVLAGMEVQTREEVHLLCLFETAEQATDWQFMVYDHLPPLKNREEVFGAQFVVDASGDYLATNDRLLLASTSLSVEQVAQGVRERDGLCIAAHVDRPSYSLLANLGFVPQDVHLDAMEITRHTSVDEMQRRHSSLAKYSFVTSGDAHRLSEMGDRTILTIQEPTISEISLAFRRQGGRRVKVVT